jgi:hypothetical protein
MDELVLNLQGVCLYKSSFFHNIGWAYIDAKIPKPTGPATGLGFMTAMVGVQWKLPSVGVWFGSS